MRWTGEWSPAQCHLVEKAGSHTCSPLDNTVASHIKNYIMKYDSFSYSQVGFTQVYKEHLPGSKSVIVEVQPRTGINPSYDVEEKPKN